MSNVEIKELTTKVDELERELLANLKASRRRDDTLSGDGELNIRRHSMNKFDRFKKELDKYVSKEYYDPDTETHTIVYSRPAMSVTIDNNLWEYAKSINKPLMKVNPRHGKKARHKLPKEYADKFKQLKRNFLSTAQYFKVSQAYLSTKLKRENVKVNSPVTSVSAKYILGDLYVYNEEE